MFEVGDMVRWGSQSRKNYLIKVGRIVAVIPVGDIPLEFFYVRRSSIKLKRLLGQNWRSKYSPKTLGGGLGRSVVSYLIAVPGKRKEFLYWPYPSKLERVDAKT